MTLTGNTRVTGNQTQAAAHGGRGSLDLAQEAESKAKLHKTAREALEDRTDGRLRADSRVQAEERWPTSLDHGS